MNKSLLIFLISIFSLSNWLGAQNPQGDLRIEMIDYYNLVVDHNIQSPSGASPRAVYIGIKVCNDGVNDLEDVFAYIGDYLAGTPGIYPTTTINTGIYTGDFSFTHEGGSKDATRYIGNLAAGECVTQYWLLSYPLVDAGNNPVFGSIPDQDDDLHLTYDVWAQAMDEGNYLEATDSKTVQLRAEITASANKIWPNNTNQVPQEYLDAFPDKEQGWRMVGDAGQPGTTVTLEGIWFRLGNINKGFDNDGDNQKDFNFMLQPVGNPALYDPSCFRLVKVSGLVVIQLNNGQFKEIPFEDQMHFKNIPINNTDGFGMVYYEFAVLDGPCNAQMSPYQEVASGKNNEKFNSDYGTSGGTLLSVTPEDYMEVSAPATASPGDQVTLSLDVTNPGSTAIGAPSYNTPLVLVETIPPGTFYVSGTAALGNQLPAGAAFEILHSTDNGNTWLATEPTPSSDVTDIQWWLNQPLGPGEDLRATLDLIIPPGYSQPTVQTSESLAIGNQTPFLTKHGTISIEGAQQVSGIVFLDDSDNSDELGNGTQDTGEQGIENVTVYIYHDSNENGEWDNTDVLRATVTTGADGSFTFTELSNASYLAVVEREDSDIPGDLTNTTPTRYYIGEITGSEDPLYFGFAPILSITNTLTSDPILAENEFVDFEVNLKNLTYAEDRDHSSAITAWAGQVGAASTLDASPENALGAPDQSAGCATDWARSLTVQGFDLGVPQYDVEKVELIISLNLDSQVSDDEITLSFVKSDGSTVTLPDPALGVSSSPGLNEYAGRSGQIVFDITGYQDWDWNVFDSAWSVSIDGIVQDSDDGSAWCIDAVGLRVTPSCCGSESGEPGNPYDIVTELPFEYQYDETKLGFISSIPSPDEVGEGVLIFSDLAPLYPKETKTVSVRFQVLQPPVVDNNCTLPEPYAACTAPSTGYHEDIVLSGNTTWESVLGSIPSGDMKKKVRVSGTGTLTVASGNLVLSSNSSLLVLDGIELIIKDGGLILESGATAIFSNTSIRTSGNIAQGANAVLCMTDSEMECGDEEVNGYFTDAGSSTSASFINDGGIRYLYNVCLNVTRDYTLTSSSGGEDVLINVCAEIGDEGATEASTGTIDGTDSGSFSTSASMKVFNSEFTVIENVWAGSNGSLDVCASKFRTLNGNFKNDGDLAGYDLVLWVDSNHKIEQNSGTWEAGIEARRGSTSGTIPDLPSNSTIGDISGFYNNCQCSGDITTGDPTSTTTTAVVSAGRTGDGDVVARSQGSVGATFINKGSVWGYVYGDADENGWIGEYGFEEDVDHFIPGVVVNLYACTDTTGELIYPAPNKNQPCTHTQNAGQWTQISTATTDETGMFRISGVENGFYYLELDESTIANAGIQTADPDLTSGPAGADADHLWKDPASNLKDVAIIGIGNDHQHISFGYQVQATIAGNIWEDINGNGTFDEGEQPLAYIPVELIHSGCTQGVDCPVVYSGGDGSYAYDEAQSGTNYTVSVSLSGIQSAQSWTVSYEEDGTADNAIAASLTAGEQIFDLDFGLLPSGNYTLKGNVYHDWSGDAHLNAGDEGMEGVQVLLYRDINRNGAVDLDEPLLESTTADSNGAYEFANKPSYDFVIELKESSLPIFPYQTEDPDEYGICTGCDAIGVVTNNRFDLAVSDAWENGTESYLSIYSTAYGDNGLDEITFPDPVGGSGENITQLAVTFNIRAFDFENSTITSEVDQVNYYYPVELNGTQIGTFNPAEQSFANTNTGVITVVYAVDLSVVPYNYGSSNTLDLNFLSYNLGMSAGERQDIQVENITATFISSYSAAQLEDLNFGYKPTGEGVVTGTVFLDDNANAVKNSGESGLSGIEIRLETDLNNDGTYAWIRSTTTDVNGKFAFTELADGEYRVVINQNDSDIPTDFTGTPAILMTDSEYLIEIAEGSATAVNGVACSGACDSELPAFGLAYPGLIVGYLFADANGNGTQDWNEGGIAGITVYLCNAAEGECNAANALQTQVTSNGASAFEQPGYYYFGGLTAGSYTVAVDTSSFPVGHQLTAIAGTDGIPCYDPLDPADPFYDLLDIECDHSTEEISIVPGSYYSGASFGYQPPGVVGNLVWQDINENGVYDASEEGVHDLEVYVENVSVVTQDGIDYNPGEYTEVAVTDFDGKYAFSNLADGMWQVQVIPPVDYAATFDADQTADNTTVITISNGNITDVGNTWCPAGQDCSMDIAFGIVPDYNNTVSGVVCLDADEDGKCNTGGETFPGGTKVYIQDVNGNSYGQVEVDLDGTFLFENLPTTEMIVSVVKTSAPLQLTTLTTSLGDTPATEITDRETNAQQVLDVSGDVLNVHFGFTFSDTFDIGDLPEPYLTELSSTVTGAVHMVPQVPDLYLGSLVDAEVSSDPSAMGYSDDNTGVDDEDGIIFSDPATWTTGTAGGSLTAEVNGNGHILAYADFNSDGDFNDAGELIIDQAVTTGTYNIDFDIPDNTDLSGGQEYYIRVRLFPNRPFSPLTSYAGIADNGEVEDYQVNICKNLTDPGTITGVETGCNGFDPAEIQPGDPVDGGGGTVEYQWQQSTDGGITWVLISGATGESYDPGPITQTTRYRRGARRAKCTDYTYSTAVTKTVLTNYTDPGAIVGNEENCGIYDPEIILNIMAPAGGLGTGTPFYQWQKSTDGGNTWNDIVTANEEYYDPGVISQTTLYRRGSRKTPCADYLYSNPITKMVSVNYTSPGQINGDESVCGTFDPSLITSVSLPAGGTDGYEVMQWEKSVNGGASWTDIPGANGVSYNPGIISQTTLYRRKARRTPCTVWVNSNVVTKTVKPFPTAIISTFPISSSGYLCELTDYEFNAEDAGANVTYEWDFGTYGSPATAAGRGPHYAQFDVPDSVALSAESVSLTTSKDGCVSTDNRVLTFRPEIVIDSIVTQDPTQCQTQDGIIWIYASYPSGTSIEYSVDGGFSWTPDYESGLLNAGVYDVRVRYQGGDCEESYGNVALSDPPPQSTLLVSSSEECTDQTIVVEAIPINSNPVFTWTFGNGAVPNTASGPGPHSIYFTNGGYASIAVTMEENNCIGVRDTSIAIVANFTNGGTIIGGETLCSTFDPVRIQAGSNPSGGVGGTLVYQWEYRESDGAGGWSAWSDVAGATDADYDPDVISTTTEFRRKSRRAPCSDWITSNSVIARLVQKPNLTDDNYNTVCPGFIYVDKVSDNDLNLVNPTFSLLVFPTNGTLDFEPDGEFIFDPNTTYCGTDEFQYLVCNDGTGCCDTATVVIDLTDTEPPTILNVPADMTLSCDDQIPVADAVDVQENCQTVSIGTNEFITQGTDGCELTNYQLVRNWNGVDYCSNTATAQQVITIEDKTSPDIFRVYTLPNGKKMVAGKMEKVSAHWKTVILPIQFSTPPAVFTQVVTRNETSPVIARLRNVSTSQFQMKLQEEEGNDDIHQQEDVTWVAFEKGALSGSSSFEVNSWLLSSDPAIKPFGQSYSDVQGFFMNMQTNNDVDPATLRYDNLGTDSVEVWVSEEISNDPETNHNLETVGYLAHSSTGNITNDNGEIIGEIGTLLLDHSQATVNLLNKYHNPVVIMGAIPSNEHDPVTVRVTGLSATGFNVSLEEWDYLDGIHAGESVSYMVIEGSLPLDQTVACDAIPDPLIIGSEIIAVDNCDPTIGLIMTESDDNYNCQTDTTFTRTWYSVDDCGNVTELTQTYYLIDTVAPVFTVPPSLTIVCGEDKDDLIITGEVSDAIDNCDSDPSVVYTDNLSNLSACNGYILRTWTATDACGNSSVKTQHIYVSPEIDSDNDGVVDYFDLDDDNDGIPDLIETFEDSDQDGIPNNIDLDSDNDGIPDLIEILSVDINGDGVVDNVGTTGWDNDGDGFAFGYDGNDIDTTILSSVVMDPYSIVNDRDGDGIPNFLDRDSDNDGIPDLIEVKGVDADGDGVLDYPVMNDPLSMVDADNDGLSDTYDPDHDNIPGIDAPEQPLIIFNGTDYKGGKVTDLPDFDNDGIPDFLDSDSDNDGISDLIEAGGIDEDGDGRIELNASFTDVNNDGFKDIYETYPLIVTQADGSDGDGRPNDASGNGTVFVSGDQDNDGFPNHIDTDSDNDGIFDILEAGLGAYNSNGDGTIGNWTDTDLNGYDDTVESLQFIFTEGEGSTVDGRAEDSGDADATAYISALADGAFAMTNGIPDVDDDGDGLPNFLDVDSDNDYLPDNKEDKNSNLIMDSGETGLFNPDSDDDLILDGIEDANRSGSFELGETNPLDPDTDDDYLEDGSEDANQNGMVDLNESDPRDPCDPFLNEACRGIVLDLKVKLMGSSIDLNGSTLMRDDLRENAVIPIHEPYTKISHLDHIGEDQFDPLSDPNNPNGGASSQGSGSTPGNSDYDETSDPGMIYITGNDAPVDWILVELRPESNPDSVIATKAGLLQRDGDVRSSDGISYLTFEHVPSGTFYVSVRHRNHLGVCTASPYILSPQVTTIDFTDPATEVYGEMSRCDMGGVMALWAGDLNGDGHVIYQGPWNDILTLFQQIILSEENTTELANYVLNGYSEADFNMDGRTIFQGPGNEKAKLLIFSVLTSPGNQLQLANFVLSQHLP